MLPSNAFIKPSVMLCAIILFSMVFVTVGCQSPGETNPLPQAIGTSPSPSPSPSSNQPGGSPNGSSSARPGSPSPSPVVDKEQVSVVKLAAVGDVLIHSSIYKDAKTKDGYDFKPMFEPIKRYIEAADLAMANQESMPGGEEIGLSDYPQFNSPYEIADALKDTGFDIVNLANNHTLDRGEQAITNAIQHMNSLGIVYTGAHVSVDDQVRIRTVEKKGIVFAFLAYTYGTNGIPVPKGKEYLVNLIELPKLKQDIEEARKQADVVVVNLHFGQEYVLLPNEEQKQVAHAAAEAGADIIIGHHPHVLQPMEWIETASSRKVFAVYSLGNFIAAQEGNRERTGGILQLEVVKTVKGREARIEVRQPAFIPTWITMTNWRGYHIVPLQEALESQLAQADTYRKEIQSHLNRWMPELQFPDIIRQ